MEQETAKSKFYNTVRIPMPLIPVYVVLFLQFIGVVFMAGVVWTKLDYQIVSLEKIENRLERVVQDNMDDRYRSTDAERDFAKAYGTIGSVKKEVLHNREEIEALQYRVRHFQAQFPKKERLP